MPHRTERLPLVLGAGLPSSGASTLPGPLVKEYYEAKQGKAWRIDSDNAQFPATIASNQVK